MLHYILSILAILSFISFKAYTQEYKGNRDSSHVQPNTLYKAITFTSAYYASSMFLLSKTWYKEKQVVPFHFYNDNGGYLQVDKFGHTFGAYVYSYLGYTCLINKGFTRNEALYFGATLGVILQTPIEIMDGLHEGYGFSWGDMAANTAGSLLVFGQEVLFKEQIIKYKFSCSKSGYSNKANGYLGKTTFDRILKDYNGQTYWLSMPVDKVLQIKKAPTWLNIAIGYGANGMYGEFENISTYNGFVIPETIRYRQYLLSMDIDWTRIKTNSKFLRIVLKGLTFVKLPFPAIEYNSMGRFKGYWIYY